MSDHPTQADLDAAVAALDDGVLLLAGFDALPIDVQLDVTGSIVYRTARFDGRSPHEVIAWALVAANGGRLMRTQRPAVLRAFAALGVDAAALLAAAAEIVEAS